MSTPKTKILVTGGTGYIGSHTVVELIASGYEVVIIDNLSNSSETVVDRIREITGVRPAFHRVEMCDKTEMQAFFEQHPDIRAVIHFAAFLQVNESVKEPLTYYLNNLNSQLNVLQCMKERNIDHFVFSSSCTVYGNPDRLPVDEQAPIKKAESAYGNTKQMGEEILENTVKATRINAISLRYFNPVGAHESALIGEVQHGVPHHLVPYITETAFGKRSQLNVFGSDYQTHDGTCVRDYIHVVDVAKAHVAAIDRLMKGKNHSNYEVFNLGTGIGYSVLDMIGAFTRATGISIKYELAPRRVGDVEAVYADTTRANRELGWKAMLSVEDMMRSAWKWEQAVAAKKTEA
jgi:UDP-glucose 4-epimerase